MTSVQGHGDLLANKISFNRLSKKKPVVRIGREETHMILRSYQVHPCSWSDMIEDVKGNISKLPDDAKSLYISARSKQLKDRVTGKLKKLIAGKELKDDEIREELTEVKALELRHVVKSNSQAIENTPGTSNNTMNAKRDRMMSNNTMNAKRDQMTEKNSSIDEDEDVFLPTRQKLNTKKQECLVDIVRANQEKYAKFMTKKVPKLMQIFGISDSESD